MVDLGSLHYKLAPGFAPQVIRAQASCKYTFAPMTSAPAAPVDTTDASSTAAGPADGSASAVTLHTQQPQQVHKFTDVLLKAVLHPSVQAVTGTQLLVQLPPAALKPAPGHIAAAASGSPAVAASYEQPQFKPAAQWNAQRSQILWAVPDTPVQAKPAAAAASAAGAPPVPPTSPASSSVDGALVPGKAGEFKARVPVAGGLTAPDAAPYSAIQPLPLQVRLSLPGAALCTMALEPEPAAAAAAVAPSGASGEQPSVRISVTGVASKAQSRVTAMYRP